MNKSISLAAITGFLLSIAASAGSGKSTISDYRFVNGGQPDHFTDINGSKCCFIYNDSPSSPIVSDRIPSPSDSRLSFNDNWKFLKSNTILMSWEIVTGLKDNEWETVNLPHTANIEPSRMTRMQWTGICWYKKSFSILPENKGKHIAIMFEAAMNDAVIWLNGIEINRHQGGYLPFYLDISGKVSFDTVNTILIRLDNRDNPHIPPGKPLKDLDFNYYSGIYRNAYLFIKNKLHITDPMEIDTIWGGGMIINTEDVSDGKANISASISVRNQSAASVKFKISGLFKDAENIIIASASSDFTSLPAFQTKRVPVTISISNPKLWSPDSPYLYTFTANLVQGKNILDAESTRIGIREIEITASKGLLINGEAIKIRGTNRHQEYPYIGYALSDNGQYRDAWKIKQAGFNFVRSSHYPQSPAFLDACDELGILVMDAIPGWQFFGDSVFVQNSYRNTREMCRRDRNHPSIVLWENSLNETKMPVEFIRESNDIFQEEMPFHGVYASGWIDTIYSVFIPARQHAYPPDYLNNYAGKKPLLIAEYGDWEYFAQNAGFNQTEFKDLKPSERSSRQLREFGEIRLLQQALNYQESYNHNLAGPAIGGANWLMFDYNRGYDPEIESSGIMDLFRIPKFSFWFYRSQSDDEPVCFIASYNAPSSAKYIRVFSNGDSVSLYHNDILMSTRLPDQNENSKNLLHPPFTFNYPSFKPGTIRADSYQNGMISASHSISTAAKEAKLKLEVDYSGKSLKADGSDVVFIYASVLDNNGNINYDASPPVTFSVEGDATLVGANPFYAEAGIATILLRAGNMSGTIRVTAKSSGLEPAVMEVKSEQDIRD